VLGGLRYGFRNWSSPPVPNLVAVVGYSPGGENLRMKEVGFVKRWQSEEPRNEIGCKESSPISTVRFRR
jgi:hypothetical protein